MTRQKLAKAKNKASKSRLRKSASSAVPVLKWPLDLPIETRKARKTRKQLTGGVQVIIFENGGSANVTRSVRTRATRTQTMPNPWPPDNIVQLIKFLLVSYPGGKAFVAILKAWMEYRAAKEITIKANGKELIIKGHMSQSRIKKTLDEFGKRINGSAHSEIEVSLPKGIKRGIPRELIANRKENKK